MEQRAKLLLYASLVGLGVLTAFFLTFPQTDIWFSRLFTNQSSQFVARSSPLASFSRHLIWNLCNAIAVFAAILLIANFIIKPAKRIPNQILGFISLSYILGPGVLANLILKANWGRARPVTVLEFGGDLLFTPPVLISDQCARNCSFISGEASSVVVIALVLVFLILPGMKPGQRWLAALILCVVALVGSLFRVAMGRHFLSDVLFAADLMLLITCVLYLKLGVARYSDKIALKHVLANIQSLYRSVTGRYTP